MKNPQSILPSKQISLKSKQYDITTLLKEMTEFHILTEKPTIVQYKKLSTPCVSPYHSFLPFPMYVRSNCLKKEIIRN
jgi:hypothetical protein